MFGGAINENNRGLLVGAAIGIGRRMRAQEADHVSEIAEIDGIHAENLARYQDVIYSLEDQLEAARRELRETQRKLAENERTLVAERCEIAGLKAFIGKIRSLDRATPGLAASGQHYESGNSKAVATLDYERAYDAKALELGFASLRGTYAR